MLAAADLPCAIPLERWDAERTDAPVNIIQTNALRFAALLPGGVARFDASAFRLGRADAAALDPQQRLLLEQVAGALQVRYLLLGMPARGPRGPSSRHMVDEPLSHGPPLHDMTAAAGETSYKRGARTFACYLGQNQGRL